MRIYFLKLKMKMQIRENHLQKKKKLKLLLNCFEELESDITVGYDGATKEEHGQNLHENLDRLISRMKAGVYYPRPGKRVYIPKPGSRKMRPLGISCFEDKFVERAINKILVEVYEPKFLDCSYGFRQGRSCHLAVSELLCRISGITSYIVEADIRDCFGSFDHDQLIRFLEHDIADRKFLELIKRGLKAGHLEGNIWYSDDTGTMQGCGYSPTLANVYMHYTLDTWFRYKTRSVCDPKDRFIGKASLIRYADDFVCYFQYWSDVRKFFSDLKVRLEKYGLRMAEEKTRVLEFGHFAAQNIRNLWMKTKEGLIRLETFDFLGFQFYCGKAKGSGRFCLKVRSVSKRVRSKINKIGEWIRINRHFGLKHIFRRINSDL